MLNNERWVGREMLHDVPVAAHHGNTSLRIRRAANTFQLKNVLEHVSHNNSPRDAVFSPAALRREPEVMMASSIHLDTPIPVDESEPQQQHQGAPRRGSITGKLAQPGRLASHVEVPLPRDGSPHLTMKVSSAAHEMRTASPLRRTANGNSTIPGQLAGDPPAVHTAPTIANHHGR